MNIVNLSPFLENNPITASAPCRLDMGGTLDIRTFYWPLSWLKPCTVNIALDMRTTVRLLPYEPGSIRVSSRGFDSAEMPIESVPFTHPLGLIFAVAYYFRAGGLHVEIDSASPPRSALGGSSVAAVALITALIRFFEQEQAAAPLNMLQTALLAHAIEESAAGVPCGMQDHLAAVYGGINRWDWPENIQAPPFTRKQLVSNEATPDFSRRLLVAYCGVPHTSKDVNGVWIKQFLSGKARSQWIEIAKCSTQFANSLENLNITDAVTAMKREMAIRKEMTPGVLDDLGDDLISAASDGDCGARITGAGAGGCIWALGEPDAIRNLRPVWEKILSKREGARILNCGVDPLGVTTHV